MDSFDRTFNFVRFMIFVVFAVIIGGFIYRGFMIVDAKNNNKTIYEIQVNNFNGMESYTTTEYNRDDKSGCIKFKDEFGIKHVVCNNYTITEF